MFLSIITHGISKRITSKVGLRLHNLYTRPSIPIMCSCFSFFMAAWNTSCRRALSRVLLRIQSWPLGFSTLEIELFHVAIIEGHGVPRKPIMRCRKVGSITSGDQTIYMVMGKNDKNDDQTSRAEGEEEEAHKLVPASMCTQLRESARRYSTNGSSKTTSCFMQQGMKGVNQDAMLVVENFASQEDMIFCGVFDGHGQDGHLVAQKVRDMLPETLASCWQTANQAYKESLSSDDSEGDSNSPISTDRFLSIANDDPNLITTWKESFVETYKLVDRELLVDDRLDCVWSGTTAVALVKQRNVLLIGNVGDSRAVLGTKDEDGSLLALQLTVDLKPNLPREADRIRKCNGRVRALRREPSVQRVWLPDENAPGLAMARALGDYCLKNYGVISEPEVTYRHLTQKDEFVVLATDGVWDVLSNQQVVETVALAPDKSLAAKAIIDAAVHAWRSRHATSKMDDCAAVCLFLDDCATASH